jgi:hypothetical protein
LLEREKLDTPVVSNSKNQETPSCPPISPGAPAAPVAAHQLFDEVFLRDETKWRAELSRLTPPLQDKHAIRLSDSSKLRTPQKISKESDSLVVTGYHLLRIQTTRGDGEVDGADPQAPRSHIRLFEGSWSPALVGDKSNRMLLPRIWRSFSGGAADASGKTGTRGSRNAVEQQQQQQLCALANCDRIPFIKKAAFFLTSFLRLRKKITKKCERSEVWGARRQRTVSWSWIES